MESGGLEITPLSVEGELLGPILGSFGPHLFVASDVVFADWLEGTFHVPTSAANRLVLRNSRNKRKASSPSAPTTRMTVKVKASMALTQ